MKGQRRQYFVLEYLSDRKAGIFLYLSTAAIFLIVSSLNQFHILPRLLYAFALSSFIWLCYGVVDGIRYVDRRKKLALAGQHLEQAAELLEIGQLKSGTDIEENHSMEAAYGELVLHLCRLRSRMEQDSEMRHHEMTDYYMMWAHQIKTPIAAMKLLLHDQKDSFPLEEELFKIEQYVEMVLYYLRLESIASDMLLKEYDLYTLVKQTVRKYSILFINSGLSLHLEEFSVKVLTDEKWLCFVLEQLLSNCIKYTKKGSVSIYMLEGADKTLVLEDTGIGIRGEDLPRIFDRGFTGYNGRIDKKSTGIGLYLCREVLMRLTHGITADSEEGKGTRICLDLSRKD